MFKKLLLCLLILSCSGCALFKSERMNVPPPAPRLDTNDSEAIKKQAKINVDLAKWIVVNGVKPNDERSFILEDGTRVMLKYVGQPYEDVDSNNLKNDRKIVDKANKIATGFQKDESKYSDDVYNNREKAIHSTNLKWDWTKIFGGGIITWIAIGIGLPILMGFFPVIIPFVSIAFQIFKAGIGAVGIVANLGLTGIKEIVAAIESFRDTHKGTEAGKALDTHLAASLSDDAKAALDKFKNFFHI